MAYVAPSTVTTLQTYTSSAHNIIVNDIIDIRAAQTNVVSASITTASSTISGTTFVDSGITANITPTNANNKILVSIVASFALVRASSYPAGAYFKLLRNATALFTDGGAQGSLRIMASNPLQLQFYARQSFQYLDSPASTSTLTYKLQGATEDVNSSILFQNNNVVSTIILQEIAV